MDVERGREQYAKQAWDAAYESLSAADPEALSAGDLELLAISAYMLGLDDAYLEAWSEPHDSHRRHGELADAARCAWWRPGPSAVPGRSSARDRVVRAWASAARSCARRLRSRGYLLLPTVHDHGSRGDHEAATAVAVEAVEIGERFDDRDLFALAMMEQGLCAGPARPRRRRPAPGRRDDGGGHHGGAVAGHRRRRLLQHDRVLSGRVRAGPGSGVDGGPYALVRSPVEHGRLHGQLSRASRRDHDLGRCLVGCSGEVAVPRATPAAP